MKNSFATLITNKKYIIGAVSLFYQLKEVKTKNDYFIMITQELYNKYKEIFQRNNIKTEIINLYKFTNNFQLTYEDTINKFQILNFKNKYEKICFLDADTFIFENIDYIFDSKNYFTKSGIGLIMGHVFSFNLQDYDFYELYNKYYFYDNDEQILNELFIRDMMLGRQEDDRMNGKLIHHPGEPKYWEILPIKNDADILKMVKIIKQNKEIYSEFSENYNFFKEAMEY